jgi:hypothetical protein
VQIRNEVFAQLVARALRPAGRVAGLARLPGEAIKLFRRGSQTGRSSETPMASISSSAFSRSIVIFVIASLLAWDVSPPRSTNVSAG